MRRSLYIYAILLFLAAPFPGELIAQTRDDFVYDKVLPGKDTLLIKREVSDWWFGICGGPNFNVYYDLLQLPLNPLREVDSSNQLIQFPSGTGSGLFLGLYGGWNPADSPWGFSIKINLLDYRVANIEADPRKLDTIELIYEMRSIFNYISISPSLRYNFGKTGIHLFTGLGVGFNTHVDSKLRYKFSNTGHIQDDRIMPLNNINIRLAYHVGMGWDFFIADINDQIRINVTPFASVHLGTSILSDYGSSWNTITTRAGLAISFGPDKVETDTLYYDPDFMEPPEYLAALSLDRGIEFPGFRLAKPVTTELAYVPKPSIVEEISEKPTEEPEEAEEEEPIIQPGKTQLFTYDKPEDTDLYSALREHLDEVAQFLKDNPGFEVRIEGHSDNSGTFPQRVNRANSRARQAFDYLVKKGISPGRILSRGRGAVAPIARNDSPYGRKRNRRVEITVVQ